MAYTGYGVNDALTVKLWSKKLDHEALKFTDIFPIIGDDENSIIHRKTEMQKGPGDQVTFGIVMLLTGAGFSSDDLAEGNGEQLQTYSDAIIINELGNVVGVKSENSIDQQRVAFNLRDTAKNGLRLWWGGRTSVSFFNQVCGYTPQTDVKYTGLQAVIAPSSTRIIRQSGRASDDLLVAGDTFTIDLVDKAKEVAITASPKIIPVRIMGGGGGSNQMRDFNNTLTDMYVMYLHPYQVSSLRKNTSTGQWLDLQKAAYTGLAASGNPIFSGAIGVYNGVVLKQAYDVTQGVGADGTAVSTVRRAVLLGGQAAMIAYGQRNQLNKYRWNEELFDHGRRLEVSAWAIWGLKKTRYNSVDYGTVVVSTYAVASA